MNTQYIVFLTIALTGTSCHGSHFLDGILAATNGSSCVSTFIFIGALGYLGVALYEEINRPELLFFKAAQNNSPSTIDRLNEQGLNINPSPYEGWAPLMHAINHNNARAVQLLLDAGADPRQVDRYGQTALDLALRHNCVAIIEILQRWQPIGG